jgi:hypothetical protein
VSNDSSSIITNLDRSGPRYADAVGTAGGVTAFAGVLMIMTGAFHVIQGVVALLNQEFFVVDSEYAFELTVSAWGWIHVVLGVLVVLAGIALFRAAVWARTVAVIMACWSLLASFAWLPHYPFWSLAVIAFDVLVIWAAVFHAPNLVDE